MASVLFAGLRFKRKRDSLRSQHADIASIDKNGSTFKSDAEEDALDNLAPELNFFHSASAAPTTKTDSKKKQQEKQQRKAKETANKDEEGSLDSEDEEEEGLKPMTAEEVKTFRNQNRIRVYGTDVPNLVRSFEELSDTLLPFLRKNLTTHQYTEPTPIQMQAIPIMLNSRDIMACAPTGSGKTVAFMLPILQSLKAPAKSGFRAVVISPTRELAQQIYRECKKLCTGKNFKVCVLTKAGNLDNANVAAQLRNHDILISTPLRLVHAIQSQVISLNSVQHLVLDEADRLLDMGFLDQIDEIVAACTSQSCQKALFSATIPSGVESLANTFMHDPIRIVIGAKNAATEIIDQKLLFVGQEAGKMTAIRQLIQQGIKPPVLIFVQSIERAKELFHELVYDNINVDVIHSERTKAQRDNIIENFRLGKTWILITTELMARGIDFKGVNLVINYDFPQSVASYIHRIGRTGRAGRRGEAVTYFTKEDGPYLKSIVNVMRESGCEVPEWMLKLPKPSKMAKKQRRTNPLERDAIKTTSKYDLKKAEKKREMIESSKKRKAKKQKTEHRQDE
ncbi:DEAD (Asp-Glu-Ala-Asp) box polypeptide 52, partial [Quaeritorhiza haematococci]